MTWENKGVKYSVGNPVFWGKERGRFVYRETLSGVACTAASEESPASGRALLFRFVQIP